MIDSDTELSKHFLVSDQVKSFGSTNNS